MALASTGENGHQSRWSSSGQEQCESLSPFSLSLLSLTWAKFFKPLTTAPSPVANNRPLEGYPHFLISLLQNKGKRGERGGGIPFHSETLFVLFQPRFELIESRCLLARSGASLQKARALWSGRTLGSLWPPNRPKLTTGRSHFLLFPWSNFQFSFVLYRQVGHLERT